MRLIEFLPLGPYRNLQPRPIRFAVDPEATPDNACSIRFLVGRNGTGKTNLLRFLTSIFLALEEDYRHGRPDSPAYNTPFRLTYELHGDTIAITSDGRGRSGVQFTINGEAREAGDIPARDRILPQAVMVYTSGDIAPWRTLFAPRRETGEEAEEAGFDTFDYDELRRGEEQIPRPIDEDELLRQAQQVMPPDLTLEKELASQTPRRIYLTRQEQLKFALLTALLHHQAHPEPAQASPFDDILVDVNIRLISFSLRYRPGVFALFPSQRRLLRRLFGLATLKLQEDDEQLWVFDLNAVEPETKQTALNCLADEPLNEPFQFFQSLAQMDQKSIIKDLKLIVSYRPPGADDSTRRTMLTENLSDGEQAFISRMALIYLLREDECLFLMDEPETHFNDDWKRNLVYSIEQALAGTNSEVILTSHASITLTDAFPDEIILLTVEGQEPVIPLTFAAEQGELLRSIFGSERSVGRRAMRHVEKAIEEGSVEDLETLLDQVGPGHYRFKIAKELQRRVSPDQ